LTYNRVTTDVNPSLAENPLLRITDFSGFEIDTAVFARNVGSPKSNSGDIFSEYSARRSAV